MFANYLAAALRNLARNGLYAGVTIGGLAIAFTAAILIALFVRDEYSYDRFIPGHERTYRVEQVVQIRTDPVLRNSASQPMLAARLKAAFPEFEAIARMTSAPFSAVRRGEVGGREEYLISADPDLFKVIPLPAIAGDPARALETPEGLVITRAKARQYFGEDRPLGKILEIENRPWRVTAVLEDYPSQTHLQPEIFTSALASDSTLKRREAQTGTLSYGVITYARLKPGASIEAVRARLPAFVQRELVDKAPPEVGKVSIKMYLTPLADIHLRAKGEGAGTPPGDEKVIAAIAAIGGLIVIVAAINFITLMTARAARRAVEVGVRKAAGARRRDLIAQFMGEAFLYVLFSALLAMALAEVLLPALNAFLQRKIELNYLRDGQIMAGLAILTLTTALAAGAYPALVLSGFNPAAVLKGQAMGTGRGAASRRGLVVFQFAVLIALILSGVTIFRQTSYVLDQGMRIDADQTLQVFVSPCTLQLRERVQAAQGVRAAACSSPMALNYMNWRDAVVANGREGNLSFAAMDFGFFDVYGVKPLAGRIFDPKRAADARTVNGPPPPVVLNESAVRKLDFASPRQAVGQSLAWHYTQGGVGRSEIIGVVPDFTFGTLRQPIEPTFYFVAGADFVANDTQGVMSTILNVKLDGARVPEGLKALDQAVSRYGDGRPVSRRFTDQVMQRLYRDTIIQGVTIGICAAIALSIACLGLFALSAYTTERRTKEIGVRKAMGAATGDVLKLLIWQFSAPVLIANLIAWPIAFLVMRRWLDGFAYRVDLAPWTFLAAGAAALAIAWATVFVHALKVARAKPVGALRYE